MMGEIGEGLQVVIWVLCARQGRIQLSMCPHLLPLLKPASCCSHVSEGQGACYGTS